MTPSGPLVVTLPAPGKVGVFQGAPVAGGAPPRAVVVPPGESWDLDLSDGRHRVRVRDGVVAVLRDGWRRAPDAGAVLALAREVLDLRRRLARAEAAAMASSTDCSACGSLLDLEDPRFCAACASVERFE